VLLVAIMAVSVLSAAGVVSTQKVAATDGVNVTPIVVYYRPGAKLTYSPGGFNEHVKSFHALSGTNINHNEIAAGGFAQTYIGTKSTQVAVDNAHAGTKWELKLPAGTNWASIKSKPCKITQKVTYYVAVAGSRNVPFFAFVSWNGGSVGVQTNNPNDPVHVKMGEKTTTVTTPLGDVFQRNATTGKIYGNGLVITGSRAGPGTGTATALALLSFVVLEFPRT